MGRSLLRTFQSPPRLRRSDLLLTLVPALLWFGALNLRPVVIEPRCASNPALCEKNTLLAFDQASVGLEDSAADHYSLLTQNASGLIALSVAPAWNLTLAAMGRVTPSAALIGTAVDLTLLLQTTLLNGVFMETTRILVQRPRPFVYADPTRGGEAANYTSFYSGHTSFAAAANVALFLTLLSRGAPPLLLIAIGALGQGLIFSTGIFRVLAGRHFATDVIVGAIAGALVAVAVAWWHRRRPLQQPDRA